MGSFIEYQGLKYRVISADFADGKCVVVMEEITDVSAPSLNEKVDAALSRYRGEMAAQEKEAK
jgi:hypothetical protein